MIDKEYGKYILICDVCGKEVNGFDTWDEALGYKDIEGWKSKRGEQLDLKDGYIDICPACIDREN